MSDSGWSLVSYQDNREQQIDHVIKAQEARLQQATKLGWARLGTSRTQVAIEEPPRLPPPLLPPSATTTAPFPSAAGAPTPPKRRDSKKAAGKEFPRAEDDEKAEREPCESYGLLCLDVLLTMGIAKGPSFGRKLKTSLLGGKNPFLSSKAAEKEKQGA